MSSKNTLSERRPGHHGRSVHYDEVYLDSPSQDTERDFQDAEQILNADPLPPPPLPLQPPFGPEFYPSDSEEPAGISDLKPVRKFIPDSWKNFFKGKTEWSKPVSAISDGTECSPPSSPTLTPVQAEHTSAQSSYQDPYGGSGGTYNSRKEAEAMLPQDPYSSLERHTQIALTYSEKVEAFNLRYSYMKSWAGLLRILGVAELLLGAAVFACVTAYIHKDNEWYNTYGYSQPYSYGASSMYGGYYYSGPKTPFVLVVAALAWIVTIILLALGMSMYYRTILLDSNWWPLTEFGINVALFILYMSAAIVYVNDANKGGLCYYRLFNTPLNASFCRIEGGQTAAMIFLFVTMIIYLIGAMVCLKLWRHESARRMREFMEQEMKTQSFPSKRTYENEDDSPQIAINTKKLKPVEMKPELLNGYIPAGHIPKPIVMPDYLAKYPVIQTDEARDRYKAVFNDQFAEYKELSAEVQAVLKKFDELDALMRKLPQHPGNNLEHDRIANVLQEYKKKKNDPSFLEKKERCEYLKNKLSHIKQRIQEYDKIMNWKT
ncbi:MARVEL domain-containing protein 2 [Hemicordylus capensis]|uniref:MARVEL domain-containing protein 2 n=1 Tax=Hemicordylus capensis TaxID=884348 RepID=UPI0023030B16|nr:MARVEL domain-containing protein 2 [Hemicordylus capensis]XP_053159017.1 MARVEL domain-containing protein 2 [Hemicordylus capensis]XP_053159019.1 MARVEL domain-containing protein 2 [Hemicordylus capensis]XP_053159020.1 MARVEL domain-containing protein 2 [Hemicordylus capensis]XP_053159021.1 MARVEL domain-containing protein 2 [Hemicordylus capensis]XP_053159022.1 MARVEL domain-containing protein 2 [Hemicordylus capensis]